SLIDMQNLRVLNGMTVTAAKDIKLSKNEETMLNNVDDNSLFGGGASGEAGSASGSDISSDTDSDTGLVETATVQKKKYTESVLLNILGDKSVREKLSKTDSGAWHFLLIKLNNPARARRVIREINTYFKNNNINARAVDWLSGAGMIAQMSSNIKTIFNVIVLIIAIVAIIIMMNTIVISVTERIPEIGTMRAIGAQKSFIRRMIIVETLMVSVIFGIIGIALGGLVLLFLYLKGIPATNIFFQILFGGKVLHPVMSVQSLVLSLVVTATIGILASLYPVSVALKIQPVQAMQRT
ncbi:MAG: FtsX-like permease family protein, partial [Spirochaetales bacterium]|nr:FtsX-like permease family protein [Spirochaetales bacterium]